MSTQSRIRGRIEAPTTAQGRMFKTMRWPIHFGPFGVGNRWRDRSMAGACVLCGGCLVAACGGGPLNPFSASNATEMLFIAAAQTWDINKDNTVTCQEWQEYTGELFAIGDKNADGAVDKDEYQHIVKSDRLFESVGMAYFDTDADGKLTAQEFSGRKNPAFGVLDRNNDCQIESAEMVRTRQVDNQKNDGSIPSVPGR